MSHLQAFEQSARQQALAHRLAERAVAADVELHAAAASTDDGRKWYDTRPMVDPREHCPECVDMAREALEYGLKCGVLIQHQTFAWLVRVDQQRPSLQGSHA